MIRRLLVLIVGAFAAWLGVAQPAVSAPEPSVHVAAYTYDSPHQPDPHNYDDSVRGPPATLRAHAPEGAGDHRPHGTPARPDISIGCGYTGRYALALPARTGIATSTTREPTHLTSGDLRSPQRSHVAANAGDDLIRLSTKDSWGNLKTLDDHFARHGADFGAASADDYARMGSEFFQRGGAQHLPTKIAPDGTIRMFDPATNTFGSFAPNGTTKTLFKPFTPDYWSRQPGVLQ